MSRSSLVVMMETTFAFRFRGPFLGEGRSGEDETQFLKPLHLPLEFVVGVDGKAGRHNGQAVALRVRFRHVVFHDAGDVVEEFHCAGADDAGVAKSGPWPFPLFWLG